MSQSARQRWAVVAVWVGVILTITSWPTTPDVGHLPPHTDKVIHFAMYGVLGGLVARALPTGRSGVGLLAVAAMSAFAALDEWHQSWLPPRTADVADWVADAAGAVTGLAAMTRRTRFALPST